MSRIGLESKAPNTLEYNESTKYFSDEDEDQDLWLLLTHTRYAVFRARERELQRYSISPEQASLLFAVQALGNKAVTSELSRHLLRQRHTVSVLINRMAVKGLVKKVKDLSRKNLIRVVITEKGRMAYEQSTKRGPIHRIMQSLSQEEKKEFRQYLQKIYAKARHEIGMDREFDQFPVE
jgi:DNA-binding MarR family transcriptional regulator